MPGNDGGGSVDTTSRDFGVCSPLEPDQVYVQISTKTGMFYTSKMMTYAGSAFSFREDSLPCFGLHCAMLITQDGRYIGRRCDDIAPFGLSLWENNPDRVSYNGQTRRWSVPTATENDAELVAASKCPPNDTRPRYLAFAYPDRDGALLACGGRGTENWYDTRDISTPLPPPYVGLQGEKADELLALGRGGRTLWRTDGNQLVIGSEGKSVGSAASVGYPWLARAADDGFNVVTQAQANSRDLRMFFMSPSTGLIQRGTYMNPDGVALGAALDYALSPDGTLFVVTFVSGKPTTVVRFDPDGSAPIVLMELTADPADAEHPLQPNTIHGLVTGG